MDVLFDVIIYVVGIAIGLTVGRARERKHYRSLVEREKATGNLPIRAESTIDAESVSDARMVTGSVVIANDYFKTAVGTIKGYFGGRLNSYESLMDRGRREAILRLKEGAISWGAREVVHLRLEASSIDGHGVEVFAFATAIK
jgi:uncharacterized protein YbjQ (UPF0145 family)